MTNRINKIGFARIPKRTHSKTKLVKALFNHVVTDCNRSRTSIDTAVECIEELNNLTLNLKIKLQLLSNHNNIHK